MDTSPQTCLLPCALQVGFAGSRQLFDPLPEAAQREGIERKLETFLKDRLEGLFSTLGVDERRYFLCGISQIAIGADTAFTRACRELDIRQRIFLPQHEDAYLLAGGQDGRPDFSNQERDVAKGLLESAHIIERRVVSEAPIRSVRFEDTNCEIAAESDLVICLLREGAEPKPGGSAQLLALARESRTPALEIQVSLRNGDVHFEERWHDLDQFEAPTLPDPLQELRLPAPCQFPGLPTIGQFADGVKRHFSEQAARQRKLFANAALIVIGTHIGATLCATLVLAGHGGHDAAGHGAHHGPAIWSLILLGIELLALAVGFGTHSWLHHVKPARKWAVARLAAEINRSVRSLGGLHMPLDYLFYLRLPPNLVPLLRTLNILHLNTTHGFKQEPWQGLRDQYLKMRLGDSNVAGGQIAYYEERCIREKSSLRMADGTFKCCTGLAFIATSAKLLMLTGVLHLPTQTESATGVLGIMAILLPVFAVGALSWAAAQGYEARVKQFSETAAYLREQRDALRKTTSARAFLRQLRETELQLLGETAEWYSRQTYGSVA